MATDYTFLEDEVRNGFYIPASVKQCFAVELDILAAIDSLCQKYDIKYYAEYGTLLGAVRHGGFIPWDDDLDIGMFRTDLEKFLTVAHELPEGYAVHSYRNRPDYTQFIYNVVNTGHISMEPSFLEKNHGFPYICGVDIFVMDNVSDDEKKENDRCTLANYVIQIADEIYEGNISASESLNIIKKVEALTGDTVSPALYSVSFAGNVPLRIRMYEIGEKLFSLFNNETTSRICQIMPWGLNGMRYYPREYYDELVRIPFENTTIPVPSRYNSMLLNRYGDYMRLVKTQNTHNYPCFEIQKSSLKNQIIENMGIDAYNMIFPNYIADTISERRIKAVSKAYETVVFLPFSGKHWNTMVKEYIKEISSPDTEVYVVPIPYYYRSFATKELINEQYDIDAYPEGLELYDWTTFDIESIHPDRIYIQYPYDEYNPVTAIHPDFYSSSLRACTDELIYIPWFEIYDFNKSEERSYKNSEAYCLTPAVINADKVILTSDVQKEVYIKKLCEWLNTSNSSSIEAKFEVKNKAESAKSYITDLLKDTEPKKSRKCIMYYIGLGQTIEGGIKYIDKIRRTLTLIKENISRINLYIKVDSTYEESLRALNPKLFDEYIQVINPIKDDDDWIYDNTEYVDYAINYCDAFYGDAGYVANLFRDANKPVMIQNLDI